MAKLNAYYTLCPLIDQQSLLGVEQDKESGWAIVSLGKNIVIRYKLMDLKQSRSWSSKDKLTSQVIYDKWDQRYAAIFNEKKIRMWSEDEEDLNNVKGHKFLSPLHTILTHDESPPILVQQNGATASLKWAVANRKTWASKGILKTKEKLLQCQLIHLNKKTSLCCLTKIEETHNCLVVKLTSNACLEKADTIKRIELKRESEELTGYTMIQHNNNAYFLTLWSHGRLYSHFLAGTSADTGVGTLISVISNINTKNPVVITNLNETTVAVYGADITDEGAILMIYNVQYKLVQAVQKLKLYTSDAKLWKVADKLLLAANRHLAVAPYQLAPQRIAAMLGSYSRYENNDDTDDVVEIKEVTVAEWEKNRTGPNHASLGRVPPKISKQVSAYLSEGWSDVAIQENLIPFLIGFDDIPSICWCLDRFKDLPEKLLVDLLTFSLRSPDRVFVQLPNGDASTSVDNPYSRYDFLDKVLSIDYSSTALLTHLKSSLTFDEVLRLLEYLTNKLNEQMNSFNGGSQPSEQQLYKWPSVLLDAYYQHYLMSQDAHVLELFNRLNFVLEEHAQFLRDLDNLRPMMNDIMNGKEKEKKKKKNSSKKYNKYYSIEQIRIF
ncbi:PREDICTED: nucleolar protein 11 [Dinoponera quadriceps]|uniref:Nucleolar protein 11 n=1 Tax=Dinoponera quadriceps TaxID=609295 RepID=A0A6P3XFX3_DINQU|nr:PREDICTED: nucleolar protein 11 [Dinoponera quadriceps]